MSINKLLFLFCSLTLSSCFKQADESPINYAEISTFSKNGYINVVIEIPAGTNRKNEYDYTNNTFPIDRNEDGTERIVQFLGYPGNYGFIPSTLMNKERGGDGDALDVMVLAETLPTATVVETQPIGILKLLDNGEEDDKIIAIPVDESKQIIKAKSIEDLPEAVKEILQTWFLNYKPMAKMQFVAWEGANKAKETIKYWQVDK